MKQNLAGMLQPDSFDFRVNVAANLTFSRMHIYLHIFLIVKQIFKWYHVRGSPVQLFSSQNSYRFHSFPHDIIKIAEYNSEAVLLFNHRGGKYVPVGKHILGKFQFQLVIKGRL